MVDKNFKICYNMLNTVNSLKTKSFKECGMKEQRTQLICAKCRGQWLQEYAQGKCGKCNEWTFAVSAKVEPIEPKDDSQNPIVNDEVPPEE